MLSALRHTWNESSALPLAVIGWSYLAYAYLLQALHIHTPPMCLFYLITGIHCPLCGMTRAFGALMGGDSENALLLNPLSPGAFAGWVAMTVGLTATSVGVVRRSRGRAIQGGYP